MKKNLREQLEAIYEPTPELYHRRVQQTLDSLSSSRATHRAGHKWRLGAVLAAALMLMTTIGAAAKLSGVLDWMTHTAARSWVLDEAAQMLHTDVSQTKLNAYTISLREWLCDGERLYIGVSVVDPQLKASDDPDALRQCAARFSLGALHLSQGETSGGMTWHYTAGEKAGEILYMVEQAIEGVPKTFDVSVPVYFPEGEFSINFRVTQAEFGRVRRFAPSPVLQAQEYTAQITCLRATALHTYGELTLEFAEATPLAQRRRIVNTYMDGLGVAQGQLNTVAGEGKEILMAHTAHWSEDDLTCRIELEGNPREEYPKAIMYCPRWDADDAHLLSMTGAVEMTITERSEEE